MYYKSMGLNYDLMVASNPKTQHGDSNATIKPLDSIKSSALFDPKNLKTSIKPLDQWDVVVKGLLQPSKLEMNSNKIDQLTHFKIVIFNIIF